MVKQPVVESTLSERNIPFCPAQFKLRDKHVSHKQQLRLFPSSTQQRLKRANHFTSQLHNHISPVPSYRQLQPPHLPTTHEPIPFTPHTSPGRNKQTAKSKKQKASSASPHHPVATRIRKQPKSAAHRPTTLKVPDQGASATNTPIRPGKERQSAVFKLKAPTRESPLLPALAASSN